MLVTITGRAKTVRFDFATPAQGLGLGQFPSKSVTQQKSNLSINNHFSGGFVRLTINLDSSFDLQYQQIASVNGTAPTSNDHLYELLDSLLEG